MGETRKEQVARELSHVMDTATEVRRSGWSQVIAGAAERIDALYRPSVEPVAPKVWLVEYKGAGGGWYPARHRKTGLAWLVESEARKEVDAFTADGTPARVTPLVPAGAPPDETVEEAAQLAERWIGAIPEHFNGVLREIAKDIRALSGGAPVESGERERDWHEDAGHENGRYQNQCQRCGEMFIGHKRRTACRACVNPHGIVAPCTDAPDLPMRGKVEAPEPNDALVWLRALVYAWFDEEPDFGAMMDRADTFLRCGPRVAPAPPSEATPETQAMDFEEWMDYTPPFVPDGKIGLVSRGTLQALYDAVRAYLAQDPPYIDNGEAGPSERALADAMNRAHKLLEEEKNGGLV